MKIKMVTEFLWHDTAETCRSPAGGDKHTGVLYLNNSNKIINEGQLISVSLSQGVQNPSFNFKSIIKAV